MTHLQSVISFGPHIQLSISRDAKRNITGFHTVIQTQHGTPSLVFEDNIGQFLFPSQDIEYHMGNRTEVRRQWIRQCLINTAHWIQQRAFELAFDDLQHKTPDSALSAFQDISDYAMPFNKNTVVQFMIILLGDKGHACDDTVLETQLTATLDNLVSNPVPSHVIHSILDTTSNIFTREHMHLLLQHWMNENSPQSATHQTLRRWLFEQTSPDILPDWVLHSPSPIWGIIQHNPHDDVAVISSQGLAIRNNLTEAWTQYTIPIQSSNPNVFGLWNGNWWIFDRDAIIEWNCSEPSSHQEIEPFLIIEEILHIDSFQGRPYALGLNAQNELYLEIWDRRNKSWLSMLGTNDHIGQAYTVQSSKTGCQVFLSTLDQGQWQWLHFDFFDQTVQEVPIKGRTEHPFILDGQLFWLQEDTNQHITCLNRQGEPQWYLKERQSIHSVHPYNDHQFVLIESNGETFTVNVVNIEDGHLASKPLQLPNDEVHTLRMLDGRFWIQTATQAYSIFC